MKQYSRNDVVRIAVEKERTRLVFYRTVAESAETDSLRSLFEYLAEQGLLVVPTFLDNRVRAVRVGGD